MATNGPAKKHPESSTFNPANGPSFAFRGLSKLEDDKKRRPNETPLGKKESNLFKSTRHQQNYMEKNNKIFQNN